VSEWNNAHDKWDMDKLKNLYADNVLFYTRQISKEQCADKILGLLKPKEVFRQSIASGITYEQYPNRIIKASFLKKVTTNNGTNNFPSYLLFFPENGRYSIIGESDMVTDEKLNYVLNVNQLKAVPAAGNAAAKRNETNYGGWIIFILFAGGVIYFIRKQKKRPKVEVKSPVIQNGTVKQEEIKGLDFEKFITEKFDKKYFYCKKWRGDKFHNGIFAEESKDPDLVYEFKYKDVTKKIAIECKYRSRFHNDTVEFKPHQLENYKKFEVNEKVPVYMVFGIGNSPNEPSELYLLPLSELNSHIVSRKKLSSFRKTKPMFFYDTNTDVLS